MCGVVVLARPPAGPEPAIVLCAWLDQMSRVWKRTTSPTPTRKGRIAATRAIVSSKTLTWTTGTVPMTWTTTAQAASGVDGSPQSCPLVEGSLLYRFWDGSHPWRRCHDGSPPLVDGRQV